MNVNIPNPSDDPNVAFVPRPFMSPFEYFEQRPPEATVRVVKASPKGYRYLEATAAEKHGVGPWIHWIIPESGNWYRPMEELSLHRRFARCSGNDKKLLAFAERYGSLDADSFILKDRDLRKQESLLQWRLEAFQMERLIYIHDVIKASDPNKPQDEWHRDWDQPSWETTLGRWIKWDTEPNRVSFSDTADELMRPNRPYRESATLGSADRPNDRLLWEPGDLVGPAQYYLGQKISERLQNNVSLQLFPQRPGEIVVMPGSLLSALYVQLANEVVGKRQPVTCPECGTPFTPMKKINQKYCTRQCESRRNQRERRRRAKEGA
jgi:hypothetical protein